jgi:hypothetical protein
MRLSILSGIVAFVFWCITDTRLKPDHVRDSNGKITFWGVLSIALVQVILWTLVGLFAGWIVPHLPRFFHTGWKLPVMVFASSILQWFALFMILQYVWTIARATLNTAGVALMARFGSQRAKEVLDGAPGQRRFMEMERELGVEKQVIKETRLRD